MRYMPHTRQTVSFDVALVLEEDFFTGAFGELEILDKFLIEFAGVEDFHTACMLMQSAHGSDFKSFR